MYFIYLFIYVCIIMHVYMYIYYMYVYIEKGKKTGIPEQPSFVPIVKSKDSDIIPSYKILSFLRS